MTAAIHAHGSSLLSRHAVHALSVGIPLAMVAVGLGWDAIRSRHRRRSAAPPYADGRTPAGLVAVVAGVAAALIHVRVVPEHMEESALYGAFFAATAVAQFACAWVLLTRWSRRALPLVVAGNAALVALWLVTRLVAVPLGPAAGTAEPFGTLDVAASLLETLLVVACLVAVRGMPLTLRRRAAARVAGTT